MTDKTEMDVIRKIAARAVALSERLGHKWEKSHAVMDIMACHSKNPLKLEELLAADDFNFGHDVFGINRHLNRDTYELEDCFLPRFSATQQ